MLPLIRRAHARMAMILPAVGILVAGVHQGDERARTAALQTYDASVAEYTAVHQRLEAPLPPSTSTRSAHVAMLNRVFLASAIKTARRNARAGDIFTPPVAGEFRVRIAEALRDQNALVGLRAELMLHPPIEGYHPQVHDSYPSWASQEMLPALLRALPALPAELEYRLLGRDLVLLDVHADLIVDVLVEAVAKDTSAHE